MGFAIFTYHSGLFGLYDLEIQTKVNFHSHSSKWPQINEKSVKFWFSMVSGLWFGLHDLHWPFSIFLRSLMSKKSSDMQQSYIRALFHQKQFLLEISHFGSLCKGRNPSEYGFLWFLHMDSYSSVETVETAKTTWNWGESQMKLAVLMKISWWGNCILSLLWADIHIFSLV